MAVRRARHLFGQKNIETRNEANGVVIRYYVQNPANTNPSIVITDAAGHEAAGLNGGESAGLNTVVWTMRPLGRGGRGGRRTEKRRRPTGQSSPLVRVL